MNNVTDQLADAPGGMRSRPGTSCSRRHIMLAKAGYPIDWLSQTSGTKRDYRKQARAALESLLPHGVPGEVSK